jgi:hypothetical protein
MIPTIGIMIGCYIITRMCSFLLRKEQRAESALVKVLAVITILVTILSIYGLISSGGNVSSGLHLR